MAQYGAQYLQWAPFAETAPDEDTAAFPKYGDPINLGPLQVVTDNPTLAEASTDGDDRIQEQVSEFSECPIDVGISTLTNEVASKVLGAKLDAEAGATGGDLHFNVADAAPYGGMAFYTRNSVNNAIVFQGIYYPKAKAAPQGNEYRTKGKSINFTGGKLKLLGLACKRGDWKVISKFFTTEEAAKAWVDAKIKKATA